MNFAQKEELKESANQIGDDELAPLSLEYFETNDHFLNIDIGVFDYVFKCIEGPYAGKFFYINSSPNGEVIGSAGAKDQNKNPEKLTMYIENCELAPKHCIITMSSHCQYLIQDVSGQEDEEPSGVWIKVPTRGEGLDLYRNDNWARKYMINQHQFQFEFRMLQENMHELYYWLASNDLDSIISILQQEGITSFYQFFCQIKEFIKRHNFDQKIVNHLKNLIKIFNNAFEYQVGNAGNLTSQDLNQEKKNLELVFTQGIQASFKLDGQSAFLVSGKKNTRANIKLHEDLLDDMHLYIEFKHGSYYMVGDHSESQLEEQYRVPNPFFNLFREEKYQIQPGDVINMGTLSYLVERFNTGVVADVGTRGSMEDTYVISQDLGIDYFLKVSLFAVIDGHGGEFCANFLRRRMELEIRRALTDPDTGLKKTQEEGVNEVITNALKTAFLNLDEAFYQDMPEFAKKCGAAAVCVLIVGNRIFCANVGDSRAVLCRNAKAINLSLDHKTSNQEEIERIKSQGGSIFCGRVENRLAITRAFGDFEFKRKIVNGVLHKRNIIIAEPEVRLIDFDPYIDDFIVIGSDGLYDKFTSKEVVNYIRTKLGNMPFMEQDVAKVARDITNEVIFAKHVRDNVTVIIIALNRGVKLN